MGMHDPVFDDDDELDRDWRALAWIVVAAMISVGAFLLAPLP